jgi:hypothetical protein
LVPTAVTSFKPVNTEITETRIKGKTIEVASILINGWRIIATGKWLKIAAWQDEDFLEGLPGDDAQVFISGIKKSTLDADIFTFRQKVPESKPKYDLPFEWDNFAVIPITSFEDWWSQKVSHNLRTDVKRAKKRGVVAKVAEFNDDFVRGITEIYNEIPVRQGRRFWHYRKDFETVKKETATYAERSDFIGAYLGDELIGFIKIVYVGNLGCMMFIISKASHQDKRPTNALIAKAVEVCVEKNCSYLTYGKFRYGKAENSLTAFKRRNGFEEMKVPQYYIPLTLKGRIAFGLGLHHGLTSRLPEGVLTFLISLRSKFAKFALKLRSSQGSNSSDESRQQPPVPMKTAGSEDPA